MKITDVEVVPLSYPIDDFPPRMRSFALLKLTTDEGLDGWGEASDSYGHAHPLALRALVDETFRWLLLGQDPLQGGALTAAIRKRLYPSIGACGLGMQAVSAIDIALWDIRGKVADEPISSLLGGQRRTLNLYAAGKPEFRLSGAEYCEDVFADLLARGVTLVKVRPGRDVDWDINFLHEVREALPPTANILVDGYCNYSAASALIVGRALEEIGALAFEEPIYPANLRDVARLAVRLDVPLAYGEHCSTLSEFRDLAIAEAAQIAEPDATACGGITEMMKVGAVCEAFGMHIMPHCGGLTAVGLAANMHAAAALSSCDWFEYDARSDQPLRDLLANGAPVGAERVSNGALAIPKGPGLGLEINADVLAAYPYQINEDIARSSPIYGTPHL